MYQNSKNLFILISKKPKEVDDVNERFIMTTKYHDDPIVGGHAGKKVF